MRGLLLQSQFMTQNFLFVSAISYWICSIAWILIWTKTAPQLHKIAPHIEKVSLILFTTGIVFYISKLQIVEGEIRADYYNRPVSWLLFAWSLNAAHLTTEIAYGNRVTALFANLWTALALTFSPGFGGIFKNIFTNDLRWLSFHRLCFLLGYAFCVLALPLGLRYFWESYQSKKAGEENRAYVERSLWKLDRMEYRMILWALPLLSAGIITEALLLLEANRFPGPQQIWMEQRETLLALAAWFICGIYLHTRLFFGWKNLKSTMLYLVGLALLMAGHLSHTYWGNA